MRYLLEIEDIVKGEFYAASRNCFIYDGDAAHGTIFKAKNTNDDLSSKFKKHLHIHRGGDVTPRLRRIYKNEVKLCDF